MHTYRIVRRAYGAYTTAETGITTWLDATLRSMAIQAERRDGEYLVRRDDAPDRDDRPTSSYQSGFDWL